MADLKSLLIPLLTAAGGGAAGYYFLGTTKSSQGKRTKKDGIEPYAVAVGGALVGYIAGQLIQSRLAPKAPALTQQQLAAQQLAQQVAVGEYMDLDKPVRRALPPAPAPAKLEQVDVRASNSDDSDLLGSFGSLEGTGEEGLGSYGLEVNADDIDVEELIRESNLARDPN